MGNSSIDESKMRLFALSCFLLICSVSGFTLPDKIENIVSAVKDIQNITDAGQDATLNMDLDAPLSVFDDDGNIVRLNLSTDYTEIESRRNKNWEDVVLFYLYTRSTQNNPEPLYVNQVNVLKRSHFAAWKPTKIVTHGWMNSHLAKSVTLVRDAFLQHGDYNVIAVDWSTIAKTPYIWASNRVLEVAKYISSMINFLETQGMDVSQLTIVGHSLGGHIAGLSALNAKSQPKYIVGLDPALPNFWTAEPGTRISRGDGKHVVIIHTNAGLLGYKAPIGDIDFYPNGGSTQIGCALDVLGACSHSRAVYYFAESINSVSGFWGVRCNDHNIFKANNCELEVRVLMGGIEPNIHATGVYYLETARTSPFAIRLANH
ncbi:phospholipase A1-like isoform X2 [Colletes latitarsis]